MITAEQLVAALWKLVEEPVEHDLLASGRLAEAASALRLRAEVLEAVAAYRDRAAENAGGVRRG